MADTAGTSTAPGRAEVTGPHPPSFWRTFFGNRMGVFGLIMIIVIVLIAVFAPWIAPYDPQKNVEATTTDFLAAPSPGHILGQDDAGKDVLSSVIYGARVSLLVGLAASLLIVVIGTTLGMIAGYFGGRVDMLIMRFVDVVLVIPQLPLMLVIIVIWGRGLLNIILVIGLLSWPHPSRVVRSQVLSLKERKYVLRARAIGVGDYLIMARHIFPQVFPVVLADAILDVSWAILAEAALSFLGLGDPTLISWGGMLHRAFLRGAVTRGAWWFLLPPGLALGWVTIALMFVGNAVQEIVNPRLKTHHLFDERAMVALQTGKPGSRIAGNSSVATRK